MPDAHGNFKGMSVPADAWERIFDTPRPSTEMEAKALGCTCNWWGRGCIIVFDSDCPIYDQHVHRKPNRDNRPTDK